MRRRTAPIINEIFSLVGLAVHPENRRSARIGTPALREGNGRQRQGFDVGANAMRKRYGWWLLVGTFLTTGCAFLAWLQRLPPDVAQKCELVQIGMDRLIVEQLFPNRVSYPREVTGHAPYDCFPLGDCWWLEVDFDDCGKVVTGKSLVHWNPDGTWYCRAWSSLQKVVPSLPDLPAWCYRS
jgi:hypothetical protein